MTEAAADSPASPKSRTKGDFSGSIWSHGVTHMITASATT